jgi:tetratricopeptide (TPR) repeat protein
LSDLNAAIERGDAAFDVEVRFERGELLRLNNRYQDAAADLEVASKLSPDHPAIMGTMGQVLLRLGRTEQAIRLFDRASTLDPSIEWFEVDHVWALLDINDIANAKRRIEALLAKRPDDPDLRYQQARILLADGKAPDAVPLLRELIGDGPPEGDVGATLLDALCESGQPTAALEAVAGQSADTDDPVLVDAWARALLAAGDHAGAAEKFQALAEADPTNGWWCYEHGRALRHAGDSIAADVETLAALERETAAIDASEDETKTAVQWSNVGLYRAALGEADASIKAYRKSFGLVDHPGTRAVAAEELLALRRAGGNARAIEAALTVVTPDERGTGAGDRKL